ncbi:rta1 domain protein [Ophiostoma piceae UAMH 11346]|uniref:Rta1 domain protein n=1 Tax=Ophiostoma piceae (strain UAMH 11346) TaxID=1262450 RepID=S3CP98_OPHP1|nr:rta1 domain protein [Ophiostoma piceae UAMH 11346]
MTNTTTDIPPNGVGELPFTPLLVPAVVFVAVFALLLALQSIVALRFWRYYGNAIGMLSGLLLELLGYVAKTMLARDRHNKNGYILYIIGLTLGPTFLSSALYLSISALLRVNPSVQCLRIGPRAFSALFVLGDFVCLCFIGVGGSLAAIFAESPVGVYLMISGLGTQILVTSIFCVVLVVLSRRLGTDTQNAKVYWYCVLLGVAAACLFLRSCWRAAELSGGFNGPLASKEGVFIALDSIPMVVMSVLLVILHPGFWFGRQTQIKFIP